jgi:uncharacterized protein (TIGR00730 family)
LSDSKDRNFLPKAYDNREFLHSAQARTLRILSEYLEPQARLRAHKIRGTIVVFGSARARSPEMLELDMRAWQEQLKTAAPERAVRIRQRMTAAEQLAKYYTDCSRLTYLLTKHYQSITDPRNQHVICSGGGPGLMEAANRGAREAGGKTVGFSISLPHEQANNRYLDPRLTFEFHYFFMRKYWFMYMARALVVFPGGFGTMDELFEMMTLVQTQKVRKRLPIVLYGSAYWEDVIRFQTMVDWGVISPEDTELFKFCNTPDEAYEHIKREVDGAPDSEPGTAYGE